ncbi:MAG: TolC family protein [Sulfuricurvum sp.]|nr:TolC family protein [Sulfuricurvum sp.]
MSSNSKGKPMKLSYSVLAIIACELASWGSEPLMLSKAYDLALKNEPHLRSVTLQVEATKESTEQSRARIYPQLQATVSWGKYEYEAPYLSKPVKEEYRNYSISASQALYHPEIYSAIHESKSRETAARNELQAEVQKLGLDVAKAYFNLLRIQRNVELFKSKREFYESKYKQLDEMLKIGLTNRMDFLEAKIHSDKALSELLAEQKRLQVGTLRLEHLIKEPVGELPSFDFTAINTDKLFLDRAQWESKLSNNPKLKASIASKEMAMHQAASRKYGHYPKVDLNINRKETFTQDTVAHNYDNQAIVQMSIPIYEGGYTQSRVREGILLMDSAQQEVEFNRLDSKLRFEEFWAEHELNIETMRAYKESEKSAELFLESVEKGNKAGLKSVVDVLEAKAKLYEVKRDTIDAGYELVNNYLSLLAVSGELNSENIVSLENMAVSRGNIR